MRCSSGVGTVISVPHRLENASLVQRAEALALQHVADTTGLTGTAVVEYFFQCGVLDFEAKVVVTVPAEHEPVILTAIVTSDRVELHPHVASL